MVGYKPGGLVRSLAGHDKDQCFIILAEDGEYVTIADGACRTVEKPKKKKKKHVQLIRGKDETLNQKLVEADLVTNEELRRTIKCYERNRFGN